MIASHNAPKDANPLYNQTEQLKKRVRQLQIMLTENLDASGISIYHRNVELRKQNYRLQQQLNALNAARSAFNSEKGISKEAQQIIDKEKDRNEELLSLIRQLKQKQQRKESYGQTIRVEKDHDKLMMSTIGYQAQVLDIKRRVGKIKLQYQPHNPTEIKLHPYFKQFGLSDNCFDPLGNHDFSHHCIPQLRGGYPYNQPYGTKRYGINVKDLYDDGNNDWLQKDGRPGEWAVAYHGVKNPDGPTDKSWKIVLSAIMDGRKQGRMLKIGAGQAHANDICKRTGQFVGRGVYCSPNVQVCAGYMKPITLEDEHGRKNSYGLILQCRVNPDKIRITSISNYWVINDTKDIRPYGILLVPNGKLPTRTR